MEEKARSSDCLNDLDQFTRGQPRELVRSCLHMTRDFGYANAKQLLQEHFGNKYKFATAYLERALSWPSIKGEDVNALQSYALFLHGCCSVTEEVQVRVRYAKQYESYHIFKLRAVENCQT